MNFDLKSVRWKTVRNHALIKATPYWIAALTVGLVSTGYAELFHWVSIWTARLFQQAIWIPFLFAPSAFLIGWAIVRYFAPTAAGSGIPQVLAAVEMNPQTESTAIRKLLHLKVGIVKIVSSLFCLLGGGAIGREGPTLQISAGIFNFVGSKAKKIWPDIDYQSWIMAGGAAGIASAFNTPLGGIVYAIEELSSAHFRKFQMAALSAVIISGVIAEAILGPYLYLGSPIIGAVSINLLPFALLVGAVSGSIGSLFGTTLFYCSNLIRTRIPPRRTFLIPVSAGLLLAAIYYFIDPRAIGPGSGISSDLLSGGADHSSIALIGIRFVSSAVSYLSGCAGGIFAPSLTIGASIGAEISKFAGEGHENLLILLGMIGFLTAITHCPFTSLVLVMEMTDRHSAIFPMMLAALTAHTLAKAIDAKSFYEKAKVFYRSSPAEASLLR